MSPRGAVTRGRLSDATGGRAGDAGPCAADGSATLRARRRSALAARQCRRGRGSGLGLAGRGEVELILLAVHADDRAGGELAAQDELRKRVLEQALDGALEGPCTERRIEPAIDEQLFGFGSDIEVDLLCTQSLLD